MQSVVVVGRVKTYEAIVKGQNVPKPGIPESFKVLVKELQALGLDIKVLDENQEEIDLKQDYDDEEGAAEVLTDDEAFSVKNDIGEEDGYAVEDAEAYLDDYNDDAEDDFIASGDDGDFSDDEFASDSMDF